MEERGDNEEDGKVGVGVWEFRYGVGREKQFHRRGWVNERLCPV
jgi:hypothetical protein